MSPQFPSTSTRTTGGLAGLGLGLAAAGVTTAAGIAADRLGRGRRTALALDEARDERDRMYTETPDQELVVVASDGVPLHVEIDDPRGDVPADASRPTVVFSHGYCMSMLSWVFQRRALRDMGYRVVLWDQRGHGRSGVGDRDSYDIDQLGEDLLMVIQATTPDSPVVMVGHSMGGMTMMAMALIDGAFVSQHVVGAGFVATTTGRMSEISFGVARPVGRLIHRVAPTVSDRLSSRQHIVDGSVKAGRHVVDFFVDWGSFGSPVPLSIAQLTTDMIVSTRMETISAFLPRFSNHDKRAALATYRGVETLVINGVRDRICPPEHSDEIVRWLPGAEHVLVSDGGHVIMLEHPTLVNGQVLGLLQRAQRHAADPEQFDLDELVSAGGRSAEKLRAQQDAAAVRRAVRRRSRRSLRRRWE